MLVSYSVTLQLKVGFPLFNSHRQHGQQRLHRITEHPKLEGTHKDHRVQLLASYRITQIQTQHLKKLSKCSLSSDSCAHCPLVKNLFLTPTGASPDTALCHSLGKSVPCHIYWTRPASREALRCYSHLV